MDRCRATAWPVHGRAVVGHAAGSHLPACRSWGRRRSCAVMELYLVRHCQATGQAPDAPLTLVGEAQAQRLADALDRRGIRRIVASPFVRARASVEPLAERLGLTVEVDDRL